MVVVPTLGLLAVMWLDEALSNSAGENIIKARESSGSRRGSYINTVYLQGL